MMSGTRLSLLAMLLCAAWSVQGTNLLKTGFPWEGCKQVTSTAGYDAELLNYTEYPDPKAPTATMCYQLFHKDQQACNVANKFPRNKTRCCATMFNKFKFWPAQRCGGSIKSVFLQLPGQAPTRRSFQVQPMDAKTVAMYTKPGDRTPPGAYWVVKMTELRLSYQQVDGTVLCFTIGLPCETMQKFAYNGKVLEWLLYDAKVNNYECCVPGFTPVLTENYSL